MCLAEVHNAVKLMLLIPATTQSRDKHSHTEPLRSQQIIFELHNEMMCQTVGVYL